MNNSNENFNDIVLDMAEAVWESRAHYSIDDVHEIVSDHCDSSPHVIYYSRAHDLISQLSMEQQGQAEYDESELSGGEYVDYDTLASRIAYSAIHAAVMEELLPRYEA